VSGTASARVEAEVAGFGASGRNGGWCVGDYRGPVAAVERDGGPGSVESMAREMHRAVDEVGAVVAEAGIDCGFHKGGAIFFATNEGQLRRVRKHHAQMVRYGLGDAWTLLDRADASAIVHAEGLRGGLFTPHAATVHPARLARGLAVEVERLGGTVHERTSVRSIDGRRVRTDHGTVRADVVVRATEAYMGSLEGQEREMVPLGNTMVATEPIDDATWATIGLADRQLFELSAVMLGYGHRTADGRIAWGGLAARTWWGGRVPPSPMRNQRGPTGCGRRWCGCSRRSTASRSRTSGAACSACPATCCRASATTPPRGSPGAAATRARASLRPTPRAGAWPTSSGASTATSPASRGSATAPAAGSPSPSAGWASTRPPRWATSRTGGTATARGDTCVLSRGWTGRRRGMRTRVR
jgi:glycine/D-amino acid oxidase-like deaminating enzyme